MQKQLILFFLIFSFLANAQKNQGISGNANFLFGWTNFKSKTTDYREPTNILLGNITKNTTLFKKNVYLLNGTVRVVNNSTLTIEPGTVIRGDFQTIGALMITKGSKIMAEGTDTDPIVFTSNKSATERKAGDWGGLIILGEAPINNHGNASLFAFDANTKYNYFGGNKPDDSSGILRFVRVEYGGKKDTTGYSSNGISLAGVGNETFIENIMVSYSFDDSFQIYGGFLNLNNIVSFRSADDDFDFTQGTQCSVSNSVAIRYPFTSGILRSRCFEIETYENFENYDASKLKTLVRLNNVTMVNNESNESEILKEAISLGEDSYVEVNQCVVTGFKSFIAFDNYFLKKDLFKKIKITNSIIDDCFQPFSDPTFDVNYDMNELLESIAEWFMTPQNKNKISKIGFANMFIENDTKKQPDFRLK